MNYIFLRNETDKLSRFSADLNVTRFNLCKIMNVFEQHTRHFLHNANVRRAYLDRFNFKTNMNSLKKCGVCG